MIFDVLLLGLLSKPETAFRQKTLTVFAAASLKESFTDIGTAFQRAKGVKVRFSFAGSQQLAAQIGAGAPADVFASADLANLQKVRVLAGTSTLFAENRLSVVVRKNGPSLKDLRGLSSFGKLVVASPKVPAGVYARKMLDKASQRYGAAWKTTVLKKVVSEEQDVRAVLTKVVLGEADAGIVYATDAFSAGRQVRTVLIPSQFDVRASYFAAVPARAGQAQWAKDFVSFLRSPEARKALKARGFSLPSPRPAP
ncbi:MAG: molybdate ABC transporter substrate-binding protein [Armatimonadetes bacterium]|nr:molybdate ABC transporter substrate-binding protein [Armatimonadota bacterium]